MVYLFNNQVALAQTPQLDAFGRLRVSQPHTLFDSQQRYGLDRSFVSNTASGGTVTFVPTQSSANLTVVNTSGSYAARETRYIFKYQPGKSQLSMMTFVMAPQSSGNLRQQVGYYDSDNGYFLQLSDQLYVCERSNITGTVTHSNVAQSSWNGDKLNGTGPSTISLDITKSQIFFIDMEWLGVGSVRTGFVINGQYIVAHTFHHANIVPNAYITTACLPVRYEIRALSASAPARSNLTQVCSTVISEAGYTEPLTLFSNLAPISGTYTSWTPVVSMRLAPTRLDAITQARQVDIALTASGTAQWALWSSSNVSGVTFTSPFQNSSVIVGQGGTMNVASSYQLASGIVTNGGGNSATATLVELQNYFSQLGRDSFTNVSDTITLAVISASGSPSGYALFSWQELL
jgi:hypothetical protein